VRTAIDLHNIEHRRLELKLRYGGIHLSTPLEYLEFLRLRRFERRAGKFPYEFIVCSETDAQALRYAPNVRVVPNGVEIPDATDLQNTKLKQAAQRSIFLFVGDMQYPPNVDAVTHFAQRVLPRIHAEEPGDQFLIVGREPPASVRRLHNGRTLIVTGTVQDVSPYLQIAAVAVVPMRLGGGTRIKILEAMAHGVPVVSTSVGAEGLDVQSGRHLLLADEPDAFAKACLSVSRDRSLQHRLAAEGYQLVREKYDWTQIERLVQQIVIGRAQNARREAEGPNAA
jgi:glycosyltransferase involved in cell wall biosynthesis